MTKPIVRRRRFDAEIIELCVRWYITYRLSYRDLVAMMAERGIVVSHTTIHRWVIRYVPEFEKRWNRFARPVNTSWRVDETYISIRGKWHFLYRAYDGSRSLRVFATCLCNRENHHAYESVSPVLHPLRPVRAPDRRGAREHAGHAQSPRQQ